MTTNVFQEMTRIFRQEMGLNDNEIEQFVYHWRALIYFMVDCGCSAEKILDEITVLDSSFPETSCWDA